MSKWITSALFCVLAVACGGGSSGSGIASNRSLVSLSDSEITSLCTYAAQVETQRTVTCDGATITIGTSAAACVNRVQTQQDAHPNCTATVADAESCFEALGNLFDSLSDAQICSGGGDMALPAQCAVLFSSACG